MLGVESGAGVESTAPRLLPIGGGGFPLSHHDVTWAVDMAAQCKLSSGEVHVLVMLARRNNPTTGCYPKQSTLSEDTGIPERTVRYHLHQLVKRGLISIHRRGKGYRGNRYKLHKLTGNPLPVTPPLTGNPLPVTPPHTGNPLPVDTGNPLPVSTDSPATHCRSIESCNPESENLVNMKVDFANAKIDSEIPEQKIPQTLLTQLWGNPKPKPKKKKPKSEDAMKIEDVLKTKMAPKTEAEILAKVLTSNSVTASAMGKLWTDAHAVYLPEVFVPELSIKQKGQLSHAYKLAGMPFVKALPALVQHWVAFVQYVKQKHDAGLTYNEKHGDHSTPHLGFVLKHIQAAVMFHREELQPSGVQLAAPKQAAVVQVVAYTPQVKGLTKLPTALQTLEMLKKAEELESQDPS